MTERTGTPRCLVCDRGSDRVPLLSFEYRRGHYHVCPQHLPVLIHDPAQLTGRLPGAEDLRPADIHD